MEKETAKVLKRWEVSLERYGKLDQWKYSHDLSVLGSYVRYSEDDKTTRKMVGQIRDKAICSLFVADSVLPLIRKTLCEENGSPSVCKEQRRSPKMVRMPDLETKPDASLEKSCALRTECC